MEVYSAKQCAHSNMLVTLRHFALVDFGWSSLSRTPMWLLGNSDTSTKFPSLIFLMSFASTGGTKENLSVVKLSRPATPVRVGVKGGSLVNVGIRSCPVTATCCNASGGGISSNANRKEVIRQQPIRMNLYFLFCTLLLSIHRIMGIFED